MKRQRCFGTVRRLLLSTLIGALLAGVGLAQEEGDWELRVCADPNSMPFTNQAEEGFENRIAEILADELGARLTYDWYPQSADMITFRLRGGECDVIMGVPDGLSSLITTVAYYRSPYVFVYRADSEFEIESLDDPILRELDIAVQNLGIPPHDALVYRGLARNIDTDYLQGAVQIGAARSRAVVDAVVEGEVDVALVWGPVVGYLADQLDVDLVIDPVTPQFEPPFRSQSFAMTLGMRQGDEALRDLLNVAIANRWDEIEAVLQEYGVPLQQIPAPVVSPLRDDVVMVGFVTPTMTGVSATHGSLYEVVGEAARMGALLAESDAGVREGESVEMEVLFASTPSAAAAERAAERLFATQGITALVGGLGDGQAEILASVAADHDSPFFNIGSPRMPRTCEPLVFHVEASSEMYLDAIAEWYSRTGNERWFVVYQDDPAVEAMLDEASEAVEEYGEGGEIVGTAAVEHEQPSYWNELESVRDTNADIVLLLLDPPDQIAFMGQQESAGVRVVTAGFPDPVTQAREFLAAARYRTREAGTGHRVLLWETTLDEGWGGELNESFTSRWGEPMEPSAWAAYQALHILHDALVATGSTNAADLVAYLESPDASFEGGKGLPLTFRAGTHQLNQPLYVVRVDPEAPWGVLLSRKIEIASLAGQVPSQDLGDVELAAAVESLGTHSEGSGCAP